MRKTKLTLVTFFCIFVFLLSLLSASALKEDFDAAADSVIYSYQCSQTTVPVKLTNTGSVGSSYDLVLLGEAAKWARTSDNNLILYPGDTKVVYLYLGVPCDTNEKGYDLKVSITTILGLEKYMDLVVNVEKPQNLNIVPVTTAVSADPCIPVNFHVQIDNRGSFIEEYELNILSKDFRDRVTISENPVLVEPNKAKDVFFYVTPFACNEYGEHAIKASAFAKNSKLYEEFYLDMIVNPTGIPVIAEGVGKIRVNYSAFEYDIPIKNLGLSTAVYNVFLEGPEWVSIAPTSFSLAPEGEGVLALRTSPTESTAEGTYTVTIVAKVANTGIEYAKDITIKLKEPTFFDTLITQYLWAIILGAIVLALLIVVFMLYLRYLERTKDVRAELKLQRQKEKEERRKEKERLNELKIKEKEKLKKEREKEREQRKAERLAAIKERRKLREQKKKERQKIKAQKKAEKLRLKKEKKAEKERARKEREKEKLRKEAEREKEKRIKQAEVESRKKERRHSVVKGIALKQLKAEYTFKPKEKKKSPWLSWLIGIIIFIVIAAGLLYTFRECIAQFFVEFWLYVVLGAIAALIIVGIIKLIARPSLRRATKRELSEAKKDLKRMLEATFDLISRKDLKKKREERRKKIREARKKASKKMPNIAKWWGVAVVVIAVLAGVIYTLWNFIAANISYILAIIIGVVIVIILFVLLSKIGTKKQKWKVLKANRTAQIPVKWSSGLYEMFVKTKRELKDVVVLIKRYSRKKTFYAPSDKVYQYFEVKRKNIENSDIDKVSFRFRVSKSWLRNMKEGSVRLLRYAGGRWIGVSTEVVNEDKRFVYFQASTAGFSHFAIVGKPVPKPKKEKKEDKRAAKKAEKDKLKKAEDKIIKAQKKAEKKLKEKEKKKEKKAKRSRKPFSFLWIGYLILAILIIGGICIAAYFAISSVAEDRTDDQRPSPIEDEVSQLDILDFEEGEDIADLDIEEVGIIPSEGLEEAAILDDIDETGEDISDLEDVEGGIPKQVWDEDTIHTLDINDYFHDPDNDVLVYSFTPVDHINIELNDGVATFTPDTNWFGEKEVVFTGDDGKGQSVDSNPVRLIVKSVPESSLFAQAKDYGGAYTKYAIVAVIVLILLILIFEYRKPIIKFLEEE